MRRTLPLALLGALALAGTAAGATPRPPDVHHTVLRGNAPILVTATIDPPVQTFGNAVTATVTVLADAKFVDPTHLRLVTNFSPFTAVGPAIEHESKNGRLVEHTWSWTLSCLTAPCVPTSSQDDLVNILQVRPAVVRGLGADGHAAFAVRAAFPVLKAISQMSPEIGTQLHTSGVVKWQYGIAAPAPSYRMSPELVFWLAVGLAILCGVAGIALVARWALRFRTPYVPAVSDSSSSALERALALFFWAGRRGDETLQRKALERVAAELPFDVADLSDVTREIAWSPDMPEEHDVEAISAIAGVLAHPQDGSHE